MDSITALASISSLSATTKFDPSKRLSPTLDAVLTKRHVLSTYKSSTCSVIPSPSAKENAIKSMRPILSPTCPTYVTLTTSLLMTKKENKFEKVTISSRLKIKLSFYKNSRSKKRKRLKLWKRSVKRFQLKCTC